MVELPRRDVIIIEVMLAEASIRPRVIAAASSLLHTTNISCIGTDFVPCTEVTSDRVSYHASFLCSCVICAKTTLPLFLLTALWVSKLVLGGSKKSSRRLTCTACRQTRPLGTRGTSANNVPTARTKQKHMATKAYGRILDNSLGKK